MIKRLAGCAVVLLMGAGVGCRRPAAAASGLKATAVGSAIVLTSGDKQAGATGTALAAPLVVQVNDAQGAAVVGALVEFQNAAGARFEPASVLTDSSGQATTAVTLGSSGGRYQMRATTPGKTQAATLQVAETALGYQQEQGLIVADKFCNRCHDSESSAARVSNYDNLSVKPHAFTDGETLNKMSDADLMAVIQHGGPALNRSALMPPYGNTLSASDVQAVLAYLRVVSDPPYRAAGTVYGK